MLIHMLIFRVLIKSVIDGMENISGVLFMS